MAEKVKYLTFNEQTNPEVLEVVNELAELEDRRPHDSTSRLILEAGKQKIAELKLTQITKPDNGLQAKNGSN